MVSLEERLVKRRRTLSLKGVWRFYSSGKVSKSWKAADSTAELSPRHFPTESQCTHKHTSFLLNEFFYFYILNPVFLVSAKLEEFAIKVRVNV